MGSVTGWALPMHPGTAMPSVSSLYADALAAFLRDRGLDRTRPGLQPAGFDKSFDKSPARRVVGRAYAQTMIAAVRDLGDSALGLEFGTRVGGGGFGLLGIAAATAPTLRGTIAHLTSHESLTSTLGRARLRQEGNTVQIEWHPAQGVAPAVIEGILSGWVSFGRHLLGEKVDVQQVSFAHRRIAPMHAYESAFECPVRFDCTGYGVAISADLLDAQPRFADAALNASLSGWLGHCAAAIAPGRGDWMRKVALQLGSQLQFADADEQTVAEVLGVGRRTLQRRLRHEGSSFRRLLEAARAQHAIIGLLRAQPSLTDLCTEVGFDEQSSLCRAFRKWTGYAPLEFRSRMSGVFCQLRPAEINSAAGLQ